MASYIGKNVRRINMWMEMVRLEMDRGKVKTVLLEVFFWRYDEET